MSRAMKEQYLRRYLVIGLIGLGLWLAAATDRVGSFHAYPQATGPTPGSFVNWESPHIHPLALTPDGKVLLVVNTADNRLEVYDISGNSPIPVSLGSIPVGLDPVSVRARTNTEAWVVNYLSDSVSIVDLAAMNVVGTLQTEDEPADVAFAGTPQRAFVTGAQASKLMVFDPANSTAPAIVQDLQGEEPRAMAVSPDGNKVYIAFFESGNKTTILPAQSAVVSNPSGPYSGRNPPPNSGRNFNPPINPNLPRPPQVGAIVRKNAQGLWKDDNNGDWTRFVSGDQAAKSGRVVGWDLTDNDVAVVDANSLQVSYLTGMMNLVMGIGVNPQTLQVTAVGTEATNEIRFEPILKGRFLRVNAAFGDAANLIVSSVVDLNSHLNYSDAQIATQSNPATASQALRDQSIGDPRGIVWTQDGTLGVVSGMGSNNVVVINSAGVRSGSPIVVGEGPTGLAMLNQRNWLYVLNKFEASISVISLSARTELARVSFFDPTPAEIKTGRKHLYDTHLNSGLGQIACASCHVDAKFDRLSWDLGNPAGVMHPFGQNCGYGVQTSCATAFHPMKGPMFTQSLQDIIGKEPFHWRGDRTGLEEFAGAFTGLQGDDVQPTATDMQEFKDFLATIFFPPNPFRNFDNTLPASLPLPGHFASGHFLSTGGLPSGAPLPPGNAARILDTFRTKPQHVNGPHGTDAETTCVMCHTLPSGAGADVLFAGNLARFPNPDAGVYQTIAAGPHGERHLMTTVLGQAGTFKVPYLRGLYKNVGFETTQLLSRSGFGFLNDGGFTLSSFLSPFPHITGDQEVADLIAFLMAFTGSDLPTGALNNLREPLGPLSQDTHAAVGKQVTFNAGNINDSALITRLGQMTALADSGKVGLVAKGKRGGVQRGAVYVGGGVFQTDKAVETLTTDNLRLAAGAGTEVTFTVVPFGSQTRIGIDRDQDGIYDADDPVPTSSSQIAGTRLHNIRAVRVSPRRVTAGEPVGLSISRGTGH